MSSSNTSDKQASMLAGHAQYAKGYAEETIGNVTGSTEWQDSGKKDTQAGIEQMKTASQQNKSEPAASALGGRLEELSGRVTGCEGMEAEGKERQAKA